MKQPATSARYGSPAIPSLHPWLFWKHKGIALRKRKVTPHATVWCDSQCIGTSGDPRLAQEAQSESSKESPQSESPQGCAAEQKL